MLIWADWIPLDDPFCGESVKGILTELDDVHRCRRATLR